MYDPRFDKLADVLVGYSLGVRRDDVVAVKGSAVVQPAVIAVCKRILQAGGHPVLFPVMDDFEELLCQHGAPHQLKFYSPAEKYLYDNANCYVSFLGAANTRSMSNVDPKKQQLRSLARKPILESTMKRAALKGPKKLRWVGTQFPCNASAQDADMSLADYTEFVFRAGMLHLPDPAAAWRKVRTAQQRACDFLNKAKEVRFVTPNGTDLRVGVAGRKWMNCCGEHNFPDGEVFTGPIEDATEGAVHYNFPSAIAGREVTDIRLKFKNGKVVDASAGKNEDFLFKMMDQDGGGRTLGEIAIGTNYAIKQYTRNTLFDEKIGGTFHAALGAAYPETGGKNKSGLHWDMVCDLQKGGRIEVDGKTISKNGRFLNKSWPQPTRK